VRSSGHKVDLASTSSIDPNSSVQKARTLGFGVSHR
jgi:hypothetical protein